MLHTYKAILRGDRLEWSDTSPSDADVDHPVAVYVTLLPATESSVTGQRAGTQMAALLEQLAQIGAFAEIDDPVTWEREQRQDRALPDRAA